MKQASSSKEVYDEDIKTYCRIRWRADKEKYNYIAEFVGERIMRNIKLKIRLI